MDLPQFVWVLRNACKSSSIIGAGKPCTEFRGANGQYVLQETCSRSDALEKMLVFAEDEGLFDFNPVYAPVKEGIVDELAERAVNVFGKRGGLLSMLINHSKFKGSTHNWYMSAPVDWSVLRSVFKDRGSALFVNDAEAVSLIATVLNTPSLRANATFVRWFFEREHVRAMLKKHYNSIILSSEHVRCLV